MVIGWRVVIMPPYFSPSIRDGGRLTGGSLNRTVVAAGSPAVAGSSTALL